MKRPEMHQKQLEMFTHLQEASHATQYPDPDDSEAWRGEDAELTPENAALRLQVIANGYLNLISQQLFWLQSCHPDGANPDSSP